MIRLKDYLDRLCNMFEESIMKYDKCKNDEDKANMYGDIYGDFEEYVETIFKELINDINEQIKIEIDEEDLL